MSLLHHQELLQGSRRQAELVPLLQAAETALRTWEPQWSALLDPALREEAEQRLGSLSELALASWGGYPGAERRRLLLQRRDTALPLEDLDPELEGLEISGNFLFDPAEAEDLRAGILAAVLGAAPGGAAARPSGTGNTGSGNAAPGDLATSNAAAGDGAAGKGEQATGMRQRGEMGAANAIGDLWIRGDRGGQGIVLASLARYLDGREGLVRTVPVRLTARPMTELQLPAQRLPKRLHTVEASLRLDAVGSAGFGISRSRMAERIRQGAVRINWQVVTSPSRELAEGERVQLEGRGELTIERVQATQRGRWRVEMNRR